MDIATARISHHMDSYIKQTYFSFHVDEAITQLHLCYEPVSIKIAWRRQTSKPRNKTHGLLYQLKSHLSRSCHAHHRRETFMFVLQDSISTKYVIFNSHLKVWASVISDISRWTCIATDRAS